MKDLMSIGRFSSICQLSIRTLRYYDEMGLLSPALVDSETGYRYYSVAQAIEAERIRILRDLEMPLEDIRLLLSESSPKRVETMLHRHRQRVEERIRAMTTSLDFLRELSLKKEEIFLSYTVERKHVEAQPVISIRFRTTMKNIGEDIQKAYGEICGYMEELEERMVGNGVVLYHGEDFNPDDIDLEACLPVSTEIAGRGRIRYGVLPEVTVAYTLHKGSYSKICGAYTAVQKWVQDNGYTVAGPVREIYLKCPDEVSTEEELRTEIAYPLGE